MGGKRKNAAKSEENRSSVFGSVSVWVSVIAVLIAACLLRVATMDIDEVHCNSTARFGGSSKDADAFDLDTVPLDAPVKTTRYSLPPSI